MATANLPSDSVSRRVLAARAASNPENGVVRRYQELLAKLSLPDLSTPLSNTSSSKSHVMKHLALKAHLEDPVASSF